MQAALLRRLAEHPAFHDFYLTGGTALSAFYLYHRYSKDLDFFTEVPQGVVRIIPVVEEIAKAMDLQVAFGRRFETLFECSLVRSAEEKVELDFALDLPGRLLPVKPGQALGMALDNPLDISCNKVSALFERSEPKDFVDVFWITRTLFPIDELLNKTRQKYPYLDDYGLAMAFFKVRSVEKLPHMILPLNIAELRQNFLDHASRLTRVFERG